MALALSFGLTACNNDDDDNTVDERYPELSELVNFDNWLNGGASPFTLKVNSWEGKGAFNFDIYEHNGATWCRLFFYDPSHSRNADLLSVKGESDELFVMQDGFFFGFFGKVDSYDMRSGVIRVLFEEGEDNFTVPASFRFTVVDKQMYATVNLEVILYRLIGFDKEQTKLLSDKELTFAVVDKPIPVE